MAEFNKLITTEKGRSLFTKVMLENKKIIFTGISTSENIYSTAQILDLSELDDVKQSSNLSRVEKISNTQIEIEAILQNLEITEGYNINSVGVYAKLDNEDAEEILYAVASVSDSNKGAYMPVYNNVTVAGINLRMTLIVSSIDNINFTVNPATPATNQDLINLTTKMKRKILNVQNWIKNNETNYYEYSINDNKVTEHHLVNGYMDLNNQAKISDGYIESYNGGYKIITSEIPTEDIEIDITIERTLSEGGEAV